MLAEQVLAGEARVHRDHPVALALRAGLGCQGMRAKQRTSPLNSGQEDYECAITRLHPVP